MCSSKNIQPEPNPELAKELDMLEIKCSNVKCGCQWEGFLASLQAHLDYDCSYTLLGCSQSCGITLQRHQMEDHELNECYNRKLLCEHCGVEFTAGNIDLHYEKCPKIEIKCPGCGEEMKQEELAYHKKKRCVARIVSCPFSIAGCSESFKECEMKKHLENSLSKHLWLMEKLQAYMQNREAILAKKEANLMERVAVIKKAEEDIKKMKKMRRELDNVKAESRKSSYEFENVLEVRNIELAGMSKRVSELQAIIENGPQSPETATCTNTTKEDTYYIKILKEEPDEVKAKTKRSPQEIKDTVEEKTMEQLPSADESNDKPYVNLPEALCSPVPSETAIKRAKEDIEEIDNLKEELEKVKAEANRSSQEFENILQAKTRELVNMSKHLNEFKKIIDSTSNTHQALHSIVPPKARLPLAMSSQLPNSSREEVGRSFRMVNFSNYCSSTSRAKWTSNPFYTYEKGYKMCFEVDCLIDQIRICLFLLPGRYDDSLCWPMRGTLTILVMNQVSDEKHYEYRFLYNNRTNPRACNQVMGPDGSKSEKCTSSSPKLSLKDLAYNAANKCQYLKNNSLILSVRCTKKTVKRTVSCSRV